MERHLGFFFFSFFFFPEVKMFRALFPCGFKGSFAESSGHLPAPLRNF